MVKQKLNTGLFIMMKLYRKVNYIGKFLSSNKEKIHSKSLNSLKKVLLIKGGQFTKNNVNNSTQTTVEVQEGLSSHGDAASDINRLNRAPITPKEKIVSGNRVGRSLKDNPQDFKPENIDIESPFIAPKGDGPLIKPEVFQFPVLNPETTEPIVDFKYIMENLNKDYKDKNVDEIMKEIAKIRELNAMKEIARKEFIKKQYEKLHIKKFARDNLKTRTKFIPLPFSNKEIFEAFIAKNDSSITYFSYFLNFIFLFLYLKFFKLIIITNCNRIYTEYRHKNFKYCIKPIIRLLVILITFRLILCFNSRLIKFIVLKLSYIIFILYKSLFLKNEIKNKSHIEFI